MARRYLTRVTATGGVRLDARSLPHLLRGRRSAGAARGGRADAGAVTPWADRGRPGRRVHGLPRDGREEAVRDALLADRRGRLHLERMVGRKPEVRRGE